MIKTFIHLPASSKPPYAVLVCAPDVFFWHWPLQVRAENKIRGVIVYNLFTSSGTRRFWGFLFQGNEWPNWMVGSAD